MPAASCVFGSGASPQMAIEPRPSSPGSGWARRLGEQLRLMSPHNCQHERRHVFPLPLLPARSACASSCPLALSARSSYGNRNGIHAAATAVATAAAARRVRIGSCKTLALMGCFRQARGIMERPALFYTYSSCRVHMPPT